MVGEKGLEPSQLALLVPKTNASTNSATRPILKVLYIIDLICPNRIIVQKYRFCIKLKKYSIIYIYAKHIL